MSTRRYAVGAELIGAGRTSVRVWAPAHERVRVWTARTPYPLAAEGNGYFKGDVPLGAGERYGFLLGDDERIYPDPASRHQPEGPEQPSAVADLRYDWTDAEWLGGTLDGQVLYEMHVGTFTPAGTWRAALEELPRLQAMGITAIQTMPIAEFAGRFGWGYDGVLWFAPAHIYGQPADLQAFVDRAHALGLRVILDVVYNHLGPAGNFLPRFSPDYFSRAHPNEWGDAINYDEPGSAAVRELVTSNVAYWIREFHVDGFRLDAAQQIHDRSQTHILQELTTVARAAGAPRTVVLIAEHEPQHATLMRSPQEGGYGIDAIYNEDLHHSMRVALTGVREAYLSDYDGSSEEWLAAVQHGFLFQGQYYSWQTAPRGAPALDRPRPQFVCFLENHDQVANSSTSRRLIELTSPAWWRAMSSLLLLGPWTPLIFQGAEWGSRTPFTYFADHDADLQSKVLSGRREFLEQFMRRGEMTSTDAIGRPAFARSTLPAVATARDAHIDALYRRLLAMRRDDGTLGQAARSVHGATRGPHVLLLRFCGTTPAADRLLVINLSHDVNLAPLPQPLVAPPDGHEWQMLFCSEALEFGGSGAARCEPPTHVVATGHAATVFAPRVRTL